jgi:CBS domain-containing protein
VLVGEGTQLVGIFAERDVVFRVIAPGLEPKAMLLREVMTADPKTLGSTQSYGHALVIMQENGFRHVPVVDEGRPVGIISSRNAMDPDLEEFVADQRRREHYR